VNNLILKPTGISPNNISLDTINPITISWQNTGDRHVKFQIQFLNNNDNSLVFDTGEIISYNSFYIIPSNTFTNGLQLKYRIQLWNINNDTIYSDWVLLKTSSTPVVLFTNIINNGTIYNSSYLFQAEYSQLELVSIKSWQMIIYDNNELIISTTSEIFNNIIEYQFSGFNNNNFYYIECQVKSQDNILNSTNKIKFNIQYEVPEANISLESQNLSDQGAVQLSWNLSQIIGESENTSFIDGEKLDTKNGRVWFDNGFNIKDNFTLKLWLENIDNTIYTINTNTSIVSYNIPLTDTTIMWFDNSAQTTQLPLNISVGYLPPSINYIWIDDNTIVPRDLTPVIDIMTPSTNKLWIDTGNDSNDTSEIIKMLNNNGDEIKVRYYNGKFVLFKNGVIITSVTVNSFKYYLYIQQIGETLTLHAEVVA
jgi:hypothetical protein